jgi:protein tyrosine/serine phosphatase
MTDARSSLLTGDVSSLLRLGGVYNLRDLGGWETRQGHRVARGRIWRSGDLCDASPADLDVLDGLGLAAIFDMRSNRERARTPVERFWKLALQTVDDEATSVRNFIDAN